MSKGLNLVTSGCNSDGLWAPQDVTLFCKGDVNSQQVRDPPKQERSENKNISLLWLLYLSSQDNLSPKTTVVDYCWVLTWKFYHPRQLSLNKDRPGAEDISQPQCRHVKRLAHGGFRKLRKMGGRKYHKKAVRENRNNPVRNIPETKEWPHGT